MVTCLPPALFVFSVLSDFSNEVLPSEGPVVPYLQVQVPLLLPLLVPLQCLILFPVPFPVPAPQFRICLGYPPVAVWSPGGP